MQLRLSLYLPMAATTSNRVRQMDRKKDQTTPLIGKGACRGPPYSLRHLGASRVYGRAFLKRKRA